MGTAIADIIPQVRLVLGDTAARGEPRWADAVLTQSVQWVVRTGLVSGVALESGGTSVDLDLSAHPAELALVVLESAVVLLEPVPASEAVSTRAVSYRRTGTAQHVESLRQRLAQIRAGDESAENLADFDHRTS